MPDLNAIQNVVSNVDPKVTQALADSVNRMGDALVDAMEQQAAAVANNGAPAAPLNVQLSAIQNVLSNVDPSVTQALANSVNRMGDALVGAMEQQAAAAENKGAPAISATFKNSDQSFSGLSEEGVQAYQFPSDTSPANTTIFKNSDQTFGTLSDADLRALGFPPEASPANTAIFKNSNQSFGGPASFGGPDPGIAGNGMPVDSIVNFLVNFDSADNLISSDGFETSQALAMYRDLSSGAGTDSPLDAQNLQSNYSIAVARMPAGSSTAAPGLPTAVPSLQINVPSSQIQMPSDVMTSLDLQPALCGR